MHFFDNFFTYTLIFVTQDYCHVKITSQPDVFNMHFFVNFFTYTLILCSKMWRLYAWAACSRRLPIFWEMRLFCFSPYFSTNTAQISLMSQSFLAAIETSSLFMVAKILLKLVVLLSVLMAGYSKSFDFSCTGTLRFRYSLT